MTAQNGGEPAMSGPRLRELAYALLRKIEHELGGLSDVTDADMAATIAECEQTLTEIKANLPPNN